jgi:hypothetical protein
MSLSPVTPANRLSSTVHPIVFEINTRVFLAELSRQEGKRVTLESIPEKVLESWESWGHDAVWLMGVWTTGKTGLDLARSEPGLQEAYREALPDVSEADVIGSPYSVKSYTVAPALGGNDGLAALRRRLANRGIGLILDFVCNHTARDHRWVKDHPEYYIQGGADDSRDRPADFFSAATRSGELSIAFGKDPYFPGWTDTAQLNHLHPGLRHALVREVVKIAGLCDGLRCDMAMLVLEEVFCRTWSAALPASDARPTGVEFWSEAISAVRKGDKDFLFIAEAYWDLEWQLQQLGFDYTYDKKLYDRLLKEGAFAVYEHLRAEMPYQLRSLRFIENHDEVRAARALPSPAWHCAAAVIASTVPGMVLYHEGQMEGRSVRTPVQLGRRLEEPVSEQVQRFYRRLLGVVSDRVFRRGTWRLLHPRAAWHENASWNNVLAFQWQLGGEARIVVVNYAPLAGQCYVEIDLDGMEGGTYEFRDLMSRAIFVRERNALQAKGIYFDLSPYGFHIFDVKAVRS